MESGFIFWASWSTSSCPVEEDLRVAKLGSDPEVSVGAAEKLPEYQ